VGCGRGRWPRSRTAPEVLPAQVDRQSGMVTAELAVALPALVLATLVAVTAVQVLCAQLKALDAADVAARLSARGEQPAVVTAAAAAACPVAQVHLESDGDAVVAEAAVAVAPAGLHGLLPTFVVRERAVYARESASPP